MKRRMLSLLLVMVMVLGMLPTIAFAAPTESSGVYQIGTAEDLLWFAQEVNGGNTGIKGQLTANINLSSTSNWPGIGTSAKPFSGSFDGQNHTVTFNNSAVGLFGCIKGSKSAVATVQNVVIAGSVKNSGFAQRAGFVHFTGCINRATLTYSGSYVAGLVGIVDGVTESGILKSDVVFTNCGNEASVSAGGGNVGGILGYSNTNTRLDGCYNTGKIYGNHDVGGLVGCLQESDGTCYINNSYNTGIVTGSSEVGGIIGYMRNGVSIANCYNSGAATYAIAGKRYDQTSSITNSYYLGTASVKCSPDYNETTRFDETTNEIKTRAVAQSASFMASAAFAELLGDSFQQSCPTPVLIWQTAVAHNGTVCENCALGSTEKEIYDVSFQIHDGFTLIGADKATQDEPYTFTIRINEEDGYQAYEAAFAVKVNGEKVTPASDGTYLVTTVSGPLSITVVGVRVTPGSYAINHPAQGGGYVIEGAKTAKLNDDYTFTFSFKDGFTAGSDFKVIAQEIIPPELLGQENPPVPEESILEPASNGVYTIPNVTKDYRILVQGVKVVSKGVTATVNFTITEGYTDFHVDSNKNLMLDQTFTVPYFDLSLYGLERYYYNEYCYKDEDGNIRNVQQKGTPESAYDHITVMHAFIVATEMYYFGYGPEAVGKGTSYKSNPAKFEEAISWSQGAGSSFMDFWDHGTNLNYYVNYEYPLAYTGWGSTSDQILIKDGDVISMHMITGNASGSRFGFFSVNDKDGKFKYGEDTIDTVEVDQGQKVKLTLYWTSTTANYSTGYEKMKNQIIYWISADEVTNSVVDIEEDEDENGEIVTSDGWNRTDFGKTKAADLVTDTNGVVTINTADVEPGVYYIAAPGGWTKGGAVDNDGFVSAGGETGPALFKLVVNEYEGKLGDVDNDTEITAKDATMILRYVINEVTDINDTIADVDADGAVTAKDATMILRYVINEITSFPAEQNKT